MRKTIHNRLYDTTTATEIAQHSAQVPITDVMYFCETLYRKRTGEYLSTARAARSRATLRATTTA